MKRFVILLCCILAFTVLILHAVPAKTGTTGTAKKSTTAAKTPAKREVVGVIGTKKIYLDEYKTMLKNYYDYYAKRGEKLDAAGKVKLNNQLWEELVAKELYNRDIKTRGLTVGKAELGQKILNDPPEQAKGIPQLQTNGNFDMAKYKMAVQNDSIFRKNVGTVIMETYPYQKLFDAIKSQVKIKADSVKDVYIKNNNKADAQVINFDWHQIKGTVIPDTAIVNFYHNNKENYKRDPARKLKYVKFGTEPSHEDSLAAKAKADSIYQAVKNGADFAAMANKFSEDPGSNTKGGEYDFFGHGRMVPEFDKASFDLKVGEISEPVKTRFGYHIIKKLDARKNDKGEEEAKVAHILIKFDTSEQTKQNRKNEAANLYSKMKEVGWDKALKGTTYKAQETPEIYETGKYIQGIGSNENLVKFAFTHSVGTLADPTVGNSGETVIAMVSDSMGVHYQSLEDSKQGIRSKLETDKNMVLNKQRAKDFFAKYGPDKYLEQAKKDSLDIVEAKDVTLDSGIPRIGNVKPLAEAMLSVEANQYTTLIEGDKASYIAYVTKRVKPDMKEWEKEKSKLIGEARKTAENQRLSQWYGNLKNSLKPTDHRADFFPELKTSPNSAPPGNVRTVTIGG